MLFSKKHRLIRCNQWTEFPDRIRGQKHFDISMLPDDVPREPHEVTLLLGADVIFTGAAEQYLRQITFRMMGNNSLCLDNIHIKNTTMPIICVTGVNQCITFRGSNVLQTPEDIPTIQPDTTASLMIFPTRQDGNSILIHGGLFRINNPVITL